MIVYFQIYNLKKTLKSPLKRIHPHTLTFPPTQNKTVTNSPNPPNNRANHPATPTKPSHHTAHNPTQAGPSAPKPTPHKAQQHKQWQRKQSKKTTRPSWRIQNPTKRPHPKIEGHPYESTDGGFFCFK